METSENFTGLGMPVFMAFGWAGEETAQKYAFSQLASFAAKLHARLPQSLKDDLPYHGLNEDDQSSYLAANENIESDVFIQFNARPASFEVQLGLINKEALTKGLKQIMKDPVNLQRLLSLLEPDWNLRVQQIHVNEDTGDQGHYQDIYNDSLVSFNEGRAVQVFEKTSYLNSDEKWITPIYLSQRITSEQAAAMKQEIIPVFAERITLMAPVVKMLRGQSARRAVRAALKAKTGSKPKTKKARGSAPSTPKAPSADHFTYVTELKPLHIKRGFINMTAEHWPFFSINARTESRPVEVVTEGMRDKDCSVWRLQPNNVARLVLSPRAQRWLEQNFVPGDNIMLSVSKIENQGIQILLDLPE